MKWMIAAASCLLTLGNLGASNHQTPQQSFYINTQQLPGTWHLIKSEQRTDGKFYKIYEREDLQAGYEKQRIIVIASHTNSNKINMRSLMRKALFPVKFSPGTKTKVHRETESEAVMEWWTADQYHSFVRIMTRPGEYHSISYLYKGDHKPSDEEKESWLNYLDSLRLNFS